MTRGRLLQRNLVYHWRGNCAVFLGVVVGTAVLTGALLVGDSLRGSLRALTLRRLGWVDEALVAPRFFREALADSIKAEHICPAILLKATAVGASHSKHMARNVMVVGVDDRFWAGWADSGRGIRVESALNDTVVLNSTLARALGAAPKEVIGLRVQKPSASPREMPLGRRDGESLIGDWNLEVSEVLGEGAPGDDFNLRPELEAPRIAFVPLRTVQKLLELPGQANALLVSGGADLASQMSAGLTLEDWGLTLDTPASRVAALFARLDKNGDGILQRREWADRVAEKVAVQIAPDRELSRQTVDAYFQRERNYLNLHSRRILLEAAVAEAALAAAKRTGLRAAPTLIYLANNIRAGDVDVPYSVVAALDPTEAAPLGPFLPAGVKSLADDEIVLADWNDLPKKIKRGERVELSYFEPEQHGTPREKTSAFRLAGFVPLAGVSGDPDLTPEFPGITDKLTLATWDPPFPYDNKRVKPRDDQFWRDYRTTPKAYVNLASGQKLWGSRFGNLTSVRLAANGDASLAARSFERALLANLSPERGGLVFDPVKADALRASSGGTDFAGLFLGFSFFLIAAALLLVGLLFRLNLDRRAPELGLLLATGYRRSTVRGLLLGEGALIATAGAMVGAVAAIGYAGLLVRFLGAIWPGGQLSSLLQPHFTAQSLAIGAAGSLLVSLLTIAWAVRVLGKVAPPALLRGQTATIEPSDSGWGEGAERSKPLTPDPSPLSTGERGVGSNRRVGDTFPRSRFRRAWRRLLIPACVIAAVLLQLVAALVKGHEAQAGAFFGSGALLLTASLAGLGAWMRKGRHRPVEQGGWSGVARLGVRNAARYPARSLLTAGLLACAAFLLVVVEAFRRHADEFSSDPDSSSGGFALLGEADLPLFADLNSEAGRAELAAKLIGPYRDELRGDNAAAQRRVEGALELLRQCQFFAFRIRAGDDTSCLNLYQARRPKLFGVPDDLISRGGFVFASPPHNADSLPNSWAALRSPDEIVPSFGEANTVTYMLHEKQGSTITVADGKGAERKLRIDGLLQDSVFQSGLLIADGRFLHLYPNQEGFTFYLIQTPAGKEREVKAILDLALAERGFEATRTAERLAAYLAVENTYLSTFQALGGLGLILGSLGLAVVLLRGVWERRGELALLRALGWRRGMLGWLVLAENGFLLLAGLAAGTLSALLAIAPQAAQVAAPPWGRLAALLGVVLAVGLTAGALAVISTLRAPLVPALRKE